MSGKIRSVLERTDHHIDLDFNPTTSRSSLTHQHVVTGKFKIKAVTMAAFLPDEASRLLFVQGATLRLVDSGSQRTILDTRVSFLWAVAMGVIERTELALEKGTKEPSELLALAVIYQELKERFDWRLPIVPGMYMMRTTYLLPEGSSIFAELHCDHEPPPTARTHIHLLGTMVREVK